MKQQHSPKNTPSGAARPPSRGRPDVRLPAVLAAGVVLSGLAAPAAWADSGGELRKEGMVPNYYGSKAGNYQVRIDKGGVGYVYGHHQLFDGKTMLDAANIPHHVSGASVEMTGGKVELGVWGASAVTASGNSVTISGGTVGALKGGMTTVYGGVGGERAENNTVTIRGGTVQGNAAVQNINVGTMVAGGASFRTAINNTVNLEGGNLERARVYGGYPSTNDFSAVTDLVSGNTLNVSAKNMKIQEAGNFENWNFRLPANIKANDAMLIATGKVDMTAGGRVRPKVSVSLAGGGPRLKPGQRVNLVSSPGGVTFTGTQGSDATLEVRQGVSAKYTFTLGADANNLYVIVGEAGSAAPSASTPSHFPTGGTR